ncbi:E3 ubiquitin-protein ligase Iruka-like isoform X1 [Osmia bicornis bicornis]|uniref:E3 ubiquitin-protein ligase Iruka-like isoform X1 n=1 Tax=Osmia bicornis bicornis TaxID=1437191 RepID=UPI0010F86AF6|nr:E3 ubiquitin-protein ligase Iruka-like isoform X1 [Osmia bicornis bicornis]
MADAVVDGTPMSRFFCHKCSIEIERLLPDYTCPRCASGFIEELESSSNDSGSGMDISSEDLSDIDDNPPYNFPQRNLYGAERDLIEMLLGISNQGQTSNAPNRNNGPTGRRRVHWYRNAQDRRRSNSLGRREAVSVENFIQEFVLNLSGVGVAQTVTQPGQLPVFNIRLFLGNPGDYVWGQDGLDAIVTQLLNQLDGTGPPPLPRKQIDEIPNTIVTQTHVESKLQCSVCWEDFKLSESVKQLACQHLYHGPCIVPWLELHGTCPICRQNLGDQNSAEVNQDTVGPSLAALFRAANESNSTRTSSTSSSGGNNSSNNSTSEI